MPLCPMGWNEVQELWLHQTIVPVNHPLPPRPAITPTMPRCQISVLQVYHNSNRVYNINSRSSRCNSSRCANSLDSSSKDNSSDSRQCRTTTTITITTTTTINIILDNHTSSARLQRKEIDAMRCVMTKDLVCMSSVVATALAPIAGQLPRTSLSVDRRHQQHTIDPLATGLTNSTGKRRETCCTRIYRQPG